MDLSADQYRGISTGIGAYFSYLNDQGVSMEEVLSTHLLTLAWKTKRSNNLLNLVFSTQFWRW